MNIKKVLIILIALMMLVSTSCKKKEKNNNNSNTTPPIDDNGGSSGGGQDENLPKLSCYNYSVVDGEWLDFDVEIENLGTYNKDEIISNLCYEAEDSSKIILDEDGIYRANGVGTTNVKIYWKDNPKVYCTITLEIREDLSPSLSIEGDHEVMMGSTLTLIVEKLNLDDEVTFASSNESVAKVSSKGIITPVATGEATIIITCGDIELEHDITVTPKPEIKISAEKTTLLIGESVKLNVELVGMEGDVTFEAWNANASVDATGLVTGKNAGTCKVEAHCGTYVSKTINFTIKAKTYSVKFLGLDDELIHEYTVNEGASSYVPKVPEFDEYVFDHWEGNYKNVHQDEIVRAIYKEANMINYKLNGGYCDLALIKAITNEPTFEINNYNYNNGTFWGGRYTDDIFIGDADNDPKATFSDRFYIKYNEDFAMYEVVGVINSGASSWAEGAEYVISISNSYNGYNLNVKPITRNIEVGMLVAFSRPITEIGANTKAKVAFFNELPETLSVQVKAEEATNLITPGRIGYKFLGWYDDNDQLVDAIPQDINGHINLTAKWEALNPVTGINVIKLDEELRTFESSQINACVEPADAYFKDLFYYSSNTDVIKVSSTGMMTAINSGTSVITITDYLKNIVFKREVTVYALDCIDVMLDTDCNGVIGIGEEIQIYPYVYGKDIPTSNFTFTSINADIATVDNLGLVKGVNEGNATIKIEYGDLSFEFMVVVKNKSNETNADKLLNLLIENSFNVVETGNACLYNDGTEKVFVSTYGSVNRYLFDEFVIHRDYEPTAEANTNCHKSRRTTDQIEFVTVHDTATLTGTVVSIASGMSSGETSIHYTTGNGAIYSVVPEKYIAYHAGDGTGTAFYWTATDVPGVSGVAPTFGVTGSGTSYWLTVNGTKVNVSVPLLGSKAPTAEDLTRLGPTWKVENGKYYIGGPLWYSKDYATIGSRGGNNNSIGIEMCVNTSSDIYDTWQRTAQLVADICIRNGLDTSRVKQHNTWSGKNCPQCLIEGGYWEGFMKMVDLNYIIMKDYSDAKISLKSNNPELLDDTGRIIKQPYLTTTVSYTITVSLGGVTKSVTLSSVIPGATTWETWDGTYSAKTIWNGKKFVREYLK